MFETDINLAKRFMDAHLQGAELVLVTGSRVFGITESDFDLCVVGDFSEEELRRYTKFVTLEKKVFSGVEFEVQVVSWDEIEKAMGNYLSWEAWHFHNAYVLHDPSGRFEKLKGPFPECKEDMLRLYEHAYDSVKNARKAHMRGMYATEASHSSEALQYSLSVLFLLNRSYIPPVKWRLYLSANLEKTVPYEESYMLEQVESFLEGVRKLLAQEVPVERVEG
ncbi:MAG: hypothetical protein R6V53_06055 [Candidatus Woesearchaeota archaeon]